MKISQPICDIAGLSVVVAGTVLAVWALAPFDVLGNARIVAAIAAPVLVVASLCAWYVSKGGRKKNVEWWRNLAIGTPLIGAMFFAVDVFVGSTNGAYTNFVQAGFHAGGPFGITITVLVCPLTTIVAAGSWVRSSLQEHFFPKSEG
jgi:heme/copper-type cytochrome/quinol oxidase subunit 3